MNYRTHYGSDALITRRLDYSKRLLSVNQFNKSAAGVLTKTRRTPITRFFLKSLHWLPAHQTSSHKCLWFMSQEGPADHLALLFQLFHKAELTHLVVLLPAITPRAVGTVCRRNREELETSILFNANQKPFYSVWLSFHVFIILWLILILMHFALL